MVEQLLSLDAINPGAIEMFRDIETFLIGFFSVPIDLRGMAFAKAVQGPQPPPCLPELIRKPDQNCRLYIQYRDLIQEPPQD